MYVLPVHEEMKHCEAIHITKQRFTTLHSCILRAYRTVVQLSTGGPFPTPSSSLCSDSDAARALRARCAARARARISLQMPRSASPHPSALKRLATCCTRCSVTVTLRQSDSHTRLMRGRCRRRAVLTCRLCRALLVASLPRLTWRQRTTTRDLSR
jgi:hypothetical protein